MSNVNYDDLAAEFQNVWDQNAGVLEAVSLLDSDDPEKEVLMAEVNGIFDSLEDMRSQYELDVEVA